MQKLPNILFISVDDLRYDCISAESERPYLERQNVSDMVSTPHIDGLAQSGVRFRQAVTASTHTPPSHASIFTGLYPPRSGIRPFFKTRLYDGVRTIGELLSSAGYATCHASNFSYFGLLGLERGISKIFQTGDSQLYEYLQNTRQPVYLFLHFYDVHDPYLFSPLLSHEKNRDYRDTFLELAGQNDISLNEEPYPYIRAFQALIKELFRKGELSVIYSLYIRGVNKFDRTSFTGVLDRIRSILPEENTLTVLFSDHGEGPGKETFGHGIELRDEMIRVPLIMSWPGHLPRNRTVDSQVRTVDILPTVLDLLYRQKLSLRTEYQPDGKSLLPLVDGGEQEHRSAYSEVWHHTYSGEEMKNFINRCLTEDAVLTPEYETYLYQRSLRTPPWKIILEGSELPGPNLTGASTDIDFVRDIFRSLMHRLPSAEEQAYYEAYIRSARGGRSGLRNEIVKTDEFLLRNFLFDTGFSEETNLLRTEYRQEHMQIFSTMSAEADRIAGSAPEHDTSPIRYESRDEQKIIEDRLRSLGYL